MPDEPEQNLEDKIKEQVRSLFADPITANRIINAATRTKPPGWGENSNGPYYKPFYANALKQLVDKMIDTKLSIEYRYATHCSEGGKTPRSLYAMVNQSINFLCNELDTPDNKYKTWKQEVNIHQSSLGIVIEYIPEIAKGHSKSGTLVPNTSTLPIWKRKMNDWLEGSTKEPFVQEGLLLTQEEVRELKLELGQLPTVMADVKPGSVRIIRLA